MARAYRMTSARRAAIKKAQRISAQRRKGKRRKRAVGAGIAAAGVIGVTLYAANGYGNRKRARKAAAGKVNVVATTMAAEPPYTGGKELDIFRRDIYSSLVIRRDSETKKPSYGLDYSVVGSDVRDAKPVKHWGKEKKAGKSRSGRGVVRASEKGVVDKVLRNRTRSADKKRAEYSPSARKAAYEANKEAIKQSNKQRARRKRTQFLLRQNVIGNISMDTSRFPQTRLTY